MKRLSVESLLHPGMVFSCAALGAALGIYNKSFGVACEPWGKLYLMLLQMSVVPILFTAVVSSLAKLVSEHGVTRKLGRIFLVFISSVLLMSAVGVLAGAIFRPGEGLSEAARTTIGQLVSQGAGIVQTASSSASEQIFGFVKEIIPSNLFAAIAEGRTLAILFFSILFGIGIGLGKPDSRTSAIATIEASFHALLKIVHWTLYGLPLGMFFIFASTFSKMGFDILSALTKLVGVTYAFIALALIGNVALIKKMTGKAWGKTLKGLQEVILVAVGTRNSFATIPSSLTALENNFDCEAKTVGLVIPLGVNLNPQGSAMFFSIVTLFAAQIYGVHLSPLQLGMVWIGSLFTAMAAAGTPGPVAFSLLSIVFKPIGIPTELAIVLLLAIDSMIDPPLTLLNVLSNCSTGVFLSSNEA